VKCIARAASFRREAQRKGDLMKQKWRIVGFAAIAALVAGCTQLGYYVQAMQGQYALLAEARPIDDWLADPQVGDKLKGKLVRVKEIRAFAASELDLPDNDSYKTYADLKRSYVLWNVVATPELSMKPAQWCFPIAGCVNYRGYYSKDEALAFAEGLRREGYDVQVSGVPAYSTLGWFSDPVLSTFIQYPDGELARLVFHELAHQVAYAPDDSKFNESFAVAVEEEGVERWMEKFGDEKMRRSYAEYEGRKDDFIALLLKYRSRLEDNYARQASDDDKRRHKAEIFLAMKEEYKLIKEQRWGGYAGYDRWFAEPLSNAHLSLIATYHDLVPAFRALLAKEKNLASFYAHVRKLAQLEKPLRHRQLAQLSEPAAPAAIAAHGVQQQAAR
jgi:predicted aminopeptidase